MVRLLLIVLLVALQWPQAIAGSLAICLCHQGALCVDGGKHACHCRHACGEEHEEHGCHEPEHAPVPTGDTTLNSDCGGEHVSLYTGESLQSVPTLTVLDLIASTPLSIADPRALESHGPDRKQLSCAVLHAATAMVVMRC